MAFCRVALRPCVCTCHMMGLAMTRPLNALMHSTSHETIAEKHALCFWMLLLPAAAHPPTCLRRLHCCPQHPSGWLQVVC